MNGVELVDFVASVLVRHRETAAEQCAADLLATPVSAVLVAPTQQGHSGELLYTSNLSERREARSHSCCDVRGHREVSIQVNSEVSYRNAETEMCSQIIANSHRTGWKLILAS